MSYKIYNHTIDTNEVVKNTIKTFRKVNKSFKKKTNDHKTRRA